MLISFCKTEGAERREFDVGNSFYNFKNKLPSSLCQPTCESNSSLGGQRYTVLPNPHKGTVDPTPGLKNSQMITCLHPLHFLLPYFVGNTSLWGIRLCTSPTTIVKSSFLSQSMLVGKTFLTRRNKLVPLPEHKCHWMWFKRKLPGITQFPLWVIWCPKSWKQEVVVWICWWSQ